MQEKTTEAWQKILVGILNTLTLRSYSHCGSAVVLKAAAHSLSMGNQPQYGNQPQGEQKILSLRNRALFCWPGYFWRTCAKGSFSPPLFLASLGTLPGLTGHVEDISPNTERQRTSHCCLGQK